MPSKPEDIRVLRGELGNSTEDRSMENLKHSAPDKASRSIDSKSLTGTRSPCTERKDNPVLAPLPVFSFL